MQLKPGKIRLRLCLIQYSVHTTEVVYVEDYIDYYFGIECVRWHNKFRHYSGHCFYLSVS